MNPKPLTYEELNQLLWKYHDFYKKFPSYYTKQDIDKEYSKIESGLDPYFNEDKAKHLRAVKDIVKVEAIKNHSPLTATARIFSYIKFKNALEKFYPPENPL